MTSLDTAPPLNKVNEDRGGKRLDAALEDFASEMRGVTSGVRRGYVYYQTCRGTRDRRCGVHEAVICPRPTLWHDIESPEVQRAPWVPEYQPSVDFSVAAGLPSLITDDIAPNVRDNRLDVPVFRDGEWLSVHFIDLLDALWKQHVSHAVSCGAPVHDPIHRDGRDNAKAAYRQGIAHVNNTFRILNGVAHTDTDLLLVDPHGRPLLIVEEYRPGGEAKHITFSRSLSAQAGGGIVVKVKSDGHPSGPLVEELWDTRVPQQLIGVSHGMRGYTALGNFLLAHPVFAPHLRR